MTQPNHSELDELYLQQTLLKLIGVKDGDPRYSDVLLIADYITANYTPKSQVAEREREYGIEVYYDDRNGKARIKKATVKVMPPRNIFSITIDNYRSIKVVVQELTKAKEQE